MEAASEAVDSQQLSQEATQVSQVEDVQEEQAGDAPEEEQQAHVQEITVTVDEEEEGKEEELGEEEMDAEIEAMKARFAKYEEEAAKISTALPKPVTTLTTQSSPGQDERSIYVGNVDYNTTNEELKDFFVSCGSVVRVTILCDKWTGPKGYAYVEFKEPQSVASALILNDTPFKGRQLKISPKRTNIPRGGAVARGRGAPRGDFYAAPRRPFRPAAAAATAAGSGGGFYGPRRPFRPRRAYHPYY